MAYRGQKMDFKKPQLFVDLAKLTNVLHDGTEQAAGFSVRVSLRYDSTARGDSIWDEFYDIPVRAGKGGIFPDLERGTVIELIKYVVENYPSDSEKLLTTIEFAEQNIDGMIIRGQHHTWNQLTDLGYKHQSGSYVTRPGGR